MSTFDRATNPTSATNAEQARQAIRRVPVVRDRLTIFRMLVMVTALAVGWAVYSPNMNDINLADADSWRMLASVFMIGLSLAGPVFALVRRRTYRLGAGGLLALTLGLGGLVMMPPAMMMRYQRGNIDNGMAAFCLYYCLPLMSLWYLAAMLVGGRLSRRSFSSVTPWSERYGLILALLWSPLGFWILWDMYVEAFY